MTSMNWDISTVMTVRLGIVAAFLTYPAATRRLHIFAAPSFKPLA